MWVRLKSFLWACGQRTWQRHADLELSLEPRRRHWKKSRRSAVVRAGALLRGSCSYRRLKGGCV